MKTNRNAEVSRRLNLIRLVDQHRSAGETQAVACRLAGISPSQLHRWKRLLETGGTDALVPARRGGRPRRLELDEDEKRKLRQLMLDHGSVTIAVEFFLEWDEAGAEALRTLGGILHSARAEGKAPSWPVCVREISRIPEVIAALHRGPKHARAFEPKARRNGWLTMEDGTEVPWAPGFIYESDDMSVNEPYRFMDNSVGRETTGRQGLFTLDAASNCQLQADLCGRPHDAYRVEDIADHLLNVVEAHGLPICWRLELGAWASNFVKGLTIKGRSERWGGLSDLFYVLNKHESTGKANIERSFDEQQKRTAHLSTSIGRFRGEFELATKLRRKADQGDEKALRYFWNIVDCADAIVRAQQAENGRPRTYPKLDGKVSTPEQLFAGRAARRPLTEADRWYFMPVKRTATIRQGVIKVKVEHYRLPFRFITYGVDGFPVFREGHPVLIAFHPARPDLGCHVFNAAEGIAGQGYAWGEKIGVADHFRDTPEEVLDGSGDYSQLQKAKAHLRAEYRTIVPKGTGPGTLKSIARDGLGNALEVQTGGTPPPSGSTADEVRRPAAPDPVPARSSRPLPAGRTRAEEIARLRALAEAEY